MRPVDVLNVAHVGLLLIEKASGLPSGSEATGVNEYDCPATTDDGGMPEIDGATFDGGGVDGGWQANRHRFDLQVWGVPASTTGANAPTASNNAMPAQTRTANSDLASLPMWQPRYRGPRGRQTGSFASPPFDGFAAFHFECTICGIQCAHNGAQSQERDNEHIVIADVKSLRAGGAWATCGAGTC